jgi:hypothetical protein
MEADLLQTHTARRRGWQAIGALDPDNSPATPHDVVEHFQPLSLFLEFEL